MCALPSTEKVIRQRRLKWWSYFLAGEVSPKAVASQLPSAEQVMSFSHPTGENRAESRALRPSSSPLPNYGTVKDKGKYEAKQTSQTEGPWGNSLLGLCSYICIVLPSENLVLCLVKELSVRSSQCPVNLFWLKTQKPPRRKSLNKGFNSLCLLLNTKKIDCNVPREGVVV